VTLIHFKVDFNFIGYLIKRFCVITKPIIICDITELLINSNCSLQLARPFFYGLMYYRMLGKRYVLLFVMFRTSTSYRDNSFCFVLPILFHRKLLYTAALCTLIFISKYNIYNNTHLTDMYHTSDEF